jgi:hypothetical protein
MGHLSSRLVRRLLLASAVIVPLAIAVVLMASTGQSPPKTHIVTTAGPLVNGVVQAVRGELPTTTLAPAPTTAAPVTSTTAAAAATTTTPTVRAAATTVSPTTTTRPAKVADPTPPTMWLPPPGTTVTTGPITPVMVTLRSSYSDAVTVTVGGQVHNLAPGQVTAPFSVMPAASGNDIIEVTVIAHPTCGDGNAGGYFFSGNTYQLSVLGGGGTCLGIVGPTFQVTPSLSTTG